MPKQDWHLVLRGFDRLHPDLTAGIKDAEMISLSMGLWKAGLNQRPSAFSQAQIDASNAVVAQYYPGTPFAAQFSEYITAMANYPTRDQIIKDPVKAYVPTNTKYQVGIGLMLARRMIDQYGTDGSTQVETYLGRLDPSVSSLIAKTMTVQKPALKTAAMNKLIAKSS